ncbi:MAG: hypothetical protein QMC81_03505 [Thermoanaerobacterales bacterium]|nr:hypothetical protein [Bacillota bacterium]MDI6906546.1 hypothetical protein [Thermoanaerobacterales bacterium]
MRRFAVKGPGRACKEISADSLDEALRKAESMHPGKEIMADAGEVLYVCDIGEDPTACRNRLV